jgi:hypothetical protein
MSKEKKEKKDDELLNNEALPQEPVEGEQTEKSGGDDVLSDDVLSIEEHQQNLEIDDAVFQAVIQYKNWASGKKVSKEVFKKAVKDFMNAPMGGE